MKQINVGSYDIQKSVDEIDVTSFDSGGVQYAKGLEEWQIEVEVSNKNTKSWMYNADIIDDDEFLIQGDDEFIYLKDTYIISMSIDGVIDNNTVTIEFIADSVPTLVKDRDQITKELM